jgi:hypothetical protein
MWQPQDEDVEALLTREARARLPAARLLRLYLDPFALFKDASCGPAPARRRARSYNRAMRWMLVPYLRRWSVIAAAFFAGIAPAEALHAGTSLSLVPAAALAVGCSIAVVVIGCTALIYFFLGSHD